MPPVAWVDMLAVAGLGTADNPGIAWSTGCTCARPAARASRSAELFGTMLSSMTSSRSTSFGLQSATPGRGSVVT